MELSTFLILLIIALIFISIGFMIPEVKFKIAYFMIIMLLGLTILNVYLSIVYYIQLRNDPGKPGPQGSKGVQGAKGAPGTSSLQELQNTAPGKCSFAEKCGIPDARTKIINVAQEMYNINTECLDNPTLETCGGKQDTLDEALPINKQINMLEQIAYSSTMEEKQFLNKIRVCVQDSNRCMDPTDF